MDLLKLDFPVRVIESERDYEQALQQMAGLMTEMPAAGSEEERLLKTLAVLFVITSPVAIPLLHRIPWKPSSFEWSNKGSRPRTLCRTGSQKPSVSVLSRKRPLTLAMIKSLHRGLGIPAASLLGDRRNGIAARA